MAIRPIVKNGVGQIGQPPPLTLDASGNVTAALVQQLTFFLQDVVRKLNGHLSKGNGDHGTQTGNTRGQWLEVQFPVAPDTPLRIPHGLGVLPVAYEVGRRDRACIVYDAKIGSWNSEVFYLACDVASANVRLELY
jgi:hypothetical protein